MISWNIAVILIGAIIGSGATVIVATLKGKLSKPNKKVLGSILIVALFFFISVGISLDLSAIPQTTTTTQYVVPAQTVYVYNNTFHSQPIPTVNNSKVNVLIFNLNNGIVDNEANYFNATLYKHLFPNLKAILLVVDSPGGSVEGTFNTISMLRQYQLPIISYIYEEGASGAFLIPELASNKVFIDNWALFGFYHNSSVYSSWCYSGYDCGHGLPQAWQKTYDNITSQVAAKRGLPYNYTYNALGYLYLGSDAVKAGFADVTAPNLQYVLNYIKLTYNETVIPYNVDV